MIDLNKKYRTESGLEVKLFEIIGHQAFGAYNHPINGWSPTKWNNDGTHDTLSGRGYELVEVPTFSIDIFVQKILLKDVFYRGKHITVPSHVKFIWVDNNGRVFASIKKPLWVIEIWQYDVFSSPIEVGRVDYKGDIKDSLEEV
jgi:hypothetical protein